MTHAAIAANAGRRQAFQRRVLAWLLLQMSLVVVVVVLGVDGAGGRWNECKHRAVWQSVPPQRFRFYFLFCLVGSVCACLFAVVVVVVVAV